MKRIRTHFKLLMCAICVNLWLVVSVAAQAPEIFKMDPPSWWTRSTANPVRLLIRGRNLHGARVQVSGAGLRLGIPKINDRGTYIFVDLFIAPNAAAGERTLSV